jgi:chitinase
MKRGTRRLSLWRVMFAIILLAGVGVGTVSGMHHWQATQSLAKNQPWFASYVDVTATPTFAFEQMGATQNRDSILSFVVSSPTSGCTPTWGGAYTLSQANDTLDLDRRIARLRQQGGNVAVSFGGLINNELAVGCTDPAKLLAAYKSVIDRYGIETIDLDLEKTNLADTTAGDRRAEVIAKLQSERRAQGKKLAVWVTLPVAPQGLAEDGTSGVTRLLAKHVDLAGVNIMTMDYGSSRAGQSMLQASESALAQTHRQLGVLYQRAGIQLSSATLWSKIGATPMIGQNDEKGEVLTLADAKGLNESALSHGIGRMSMWSANRDRVCGSNYVDVKVVSDSCSGVKQDAYSFALALSAGFKGNLTQSAGAVTTADSTTTVQKPDDPAGSPYQIWSESGAYLQGTKVVWHRNVYEAKWWTQGDTPDSPVLQAYQTPWDLIGPVLPGEKPIPQPTLAPKTYPNWSGTTAYNTSQRVLFNGVPYQAKWWNTGQSPAAASSNANGSPWVPLTQEQINAIAPKSSTP